MTLEHISNVKGTVFRKVGITEENLVIRKCFEDEIGLRASKNAEVFRIRNGVITVGVKSSVYMHDLSMKKRDIIKNINQRLGGKKIKEIKFVAC